MGCIDTGLQKGCGFSTHVVTHVALQITRPRKRVNDEMFAMINSTIPKLARSRAHTHTHTHTHTHNIMCCFKDTV